MTNNDGCRTGDTAGYYILKGGRYWLLFGDIIVLRAGTTSTSIGGREGSVVSLTDGGYIGHYCASTARIPPLMSRKQLILMYLDTTKEAWKAKQNCSRVQAECAKR